MKFLKFIWKLLKSKTIDFNAGYAALIVLLSALGFEIDPKIVAAVAALMNWILRAITKTALMDK